MMAAPRMIAALPIAALLAATAVAQQVSYETGPDGTKYQVTRTVVPRTVAVTEKQSQPQTYYRQQTTTENQQFQQVYQVPVTQYQAVPRLVGRWNPFVEPYWTYEYQAVTTYQQQVATVTMPTARVAWVPETRTVEAPITRYVTVQDETIHKVALTGPTTGSASGATQLAAAPTMPMAPAGPSATLAARPTTAAPAIVAGANPTYGAPGTTYGGTIMREDPPRQASGGWQQSPTGSRYQ